MENYPDFLDELADYLEVSGVAPGASIKVNKLVDSPDKMVALLGIAGTTLSINRDIPDLRFPRFQVICRDVEYADASSLHKRVRDALHGKVGLLLPHYRVLRIHAEQDGGPIGEDDKGRAEFSINFNTEFHYGDSVGYGE